MSGFCSFVKEITGSCTARIGLWPTVALSAGLTVGTAILIYKTPAAVRYLAEYFGKDDKGAATGDSGTDVDKAYRLANRSDPRPLSLNSVLPTPAVPLGTSDSGTDVDGVPCRGENSPPALEPTRSTPV